MEAVWYDIMLWLINAVHGLTGPFMHFFAAMSIGIEAAILIYSRKHGGIG
jgi:hypothetical protein